MTDGYVPFVKYLLTELQYIYNDLKDEYENIIIEKYSYNAKLYTVVLTIFAACSIITLIVAQFWTSIIGNILSKNVSQSRNLFITTEYFIDQEKHFYLIALHTYAAISIGCIATIAIGAMLVAYFQHICGMLSISRYRIERVMRINMLQNSLKNENLIFKGMIYAIDIHRQAMKLSKLMVSKFEIMLFCLIAVGVICLSLNLFRVSFKLLKKDLNFSSD
ncbi:PREDICTED: uncharacterized protein LOC108752704 [Trachymyrmex septentrionalis]|uniref:uncharacterized protein LOC108752704 n=1 Tax=Trachymyrmex septentrionalis TaxID=34720 RepID=UPI00084F08C9|nr:PREDICTED: uncharacterized protein LOC108752704 [Trachymyrmex septentrionalis]